MKKIRIFLVIIILFFVMIFLSGCEINVDENLSVEDKITEEIEYIENKILTFYSMYAKGEYGVLEEINWDLIEENVIDLNGVLDTIILDMAEVEISNEDIIAFKDGVNRLSIATSNRNINAVLEEYNILYSILPKYAQNAFKNKNDVKRLELKSQIVSSFVYANLFDWESASTGINLADAKYKEMMDDVDYMKEYSYNLNKIFILLSEIKNAIGLQELELVKIKYVNFIEKI